MLITRFPARDGSYLDPRIRKTYALSSFYVVSQWFTARELATTSGEAATDAGLKSTPRVRNCLQLLYIRAHSATLSPVPKLSPLLSAAENSCRYIYQRWCCSALGLYIPLSLYMYMDRSPLVISVLRMLLLYIMACETLCWCCWKYNFPRLIPAPWLSSLVHIHGLSFTLPFSSNTAAITIARYSRHGIYYKCIHLLHYAFSSKLKAPILKTKNKEDHYRQTLCSLSVFFIHF